MHIYMGYFCAIEFTIYTNPDLTNESMEIDQGGKC
jgi:hypothetical protein